MADVVKRPGNTDISLPEGVRLLRQQLKESAVTDDGGAGIMVALQDKVMRAESVDDVLDLGLAGPAEIDNYLDKPLKIIDYKPLRAAEQFQEANRTNFFAVIAAIDLLEGTEVTLTCGGEFLIAQLQRITNMPGGLPFVAAIYRVPTGSGYHVYKLRPLNATERRAVNMDVR